MIYAISHGVLNQTLFCFYYLVGIFFINSGKQFSFFCIGKGSIDFMPVMPWLLHGKDWCDDASLFFFRKQFFYFLLLPGQLLCIL